MSPTATTHQHRLEKFHADQRAILERIASGSPLPDFLDRIVRLVEEQASAMICSILLFDQSQNVLRYGAAPNLPSEFSRAIDGAAIGPHAGSCGTAAFRRETVIVTDIAANSYWADYKQFALPHKLVACWSTPIFSPNRELLGTFAMYYKEQRGPSNEEVEWVNAATHLAAIAICRDRTEQLLRKSEERARHLAHVYALANSINEAIVRIRSPQELYEIACRIAVEKGLLRLAWVGVCNVEEGNLKPAARYGADDGFIDRLTLRLRDGQNDQGPIGRALTTGTPAYSNDISTEVDGRWREEYIQRRLLSSAAFPIRHGKTIVGVFVLYAGRAGFFSSDELQVLGGLAANISFVVQSAGAELERKRLVGALSERIKELTLLHRVSRLLGTRQSFDQQLLSELVSFLPLGWQFPEVCEARIVWDGLEARTPGWRKTPWVLSSSFSACGLSGLVEISYTAERPTAVEGPFLAEERNCLDSLAEIFGAHLQNHLSGTALRESEERLRAVVENTPDVAVQWYDSKGLVRFWNRASESMFGWSASDAVGKPLDQLIFGPGENAKFLAAINQIQSTGQPQRPAEFAFRRRDGSEGYCLSTVFRIPLSSSQSGLACMDVDLTDRKRAEKALSESLEELRHANQKVQFYVSKIPMAYLVWDRNLTVSEWNPAAERIFGWTAAEAIGRQLYDLIVPADALAHVKRVWTDLMAGGDWSAHSVNENTRKDGSRLVCEWFNAPLRDADGQMIGCLSIGIDISERKKADEERNQLEAQLRHMQRIQSLGTLAGGVAHDFNNILMAVNGNTALALQDTPPDSSVYACLLQIKKAGDRAVDLVRRILTFSREQEPLRKMIGLQDIVEETVALLRAATPSRIEIHTKCEASLPKVSADATQIHQIVMNLGTNAVHAIGGRSGRIDLELDSFMFDSNITLKNAELKQGPYVRLTVRDTGSGMSPAIVERIFDPFFTTKTGGQGTGLGLSMVHGIVKNHGGTIKVTSQPEHGATFEVFFPACLTTEPEPIVQSVKPLRGRGEHILYVDDEEPLVYLASCFLERLGYKVSGFSDGSQALDTFRATPEAFDAVVSDLSMPGLSGAEFAGEIRNIRRDVAIILTSGYISAEDLHAVQHLNIFDFILKPNTVDDLAQILHRLFQERRRSLEQGSS